MKLAFTLAALGGTVAAGISALNMPIFIPGVALMSGNMGLAVGALAGLSVAGLSNDDNPFAFIGGLLGAFASFFGAVGVVIASVQSFDNPMEGKLLSVITERHGEDMRRLRAGQEIPFNLHLTGGVNILMNATAKNDARIELVAGDKGDPIQVRACADFTVVQRENTADVKSIDVTVCNKRALRFDETVRIVQSLNP